MTDHIPLLAIEFRNTKNRTYTVNCYRMTAAKNVHTIVSGEDFGIEWVSIEAYAKRWLTRKTICPLDFNVRYPDVVIGMLAKDIQDIRDIKGRRTMLLPKTMRKAMLDTCKRFFPACTCATCFPTSRLKRIFAPRRFPSRFMFYHIS